MASSVEQLLRENLHKSKEAEGVSRGREAVIGHTEIMCVCWIDKLIAPPFYCRLPLYSPPPHGSRVVAQSTPLKRVYICVHMYRFVLDCLRGPDSARSWGELGLGGR